MIDIDNVSLFPAMSHASTSLRFSTPEQSLERISTMPAAATEKGLEQHKQTISTQVVNIRLETHIITVYYFKSSKYFDFTGWYIP